MLFRLISFLAYMLEQFQSKTSTCDEKMPVKKSMILYQKDGNSKILRPSMSIVLKHEVIQ